MIVSEKAFEVKQVKEFLQALPYAAYDREYRLDLYPYDSAKAGIDKLESDTAKEHVYDLAIVSHKMKKMSGLQFAQIVAQKKGIPPIPILLLVEEMNPQLRDEAAKVNIGALLKLPLKGEDLQKAVTDLAELAVIRLEQRRDAELEMLEMAGGDQAAAREDLSQKAVADFARARMLAPWSAAAGMAYARILAEGGQCAEAMPVLQAIIKNSFTNKDAHKLLAECYRRTGKSIDDAAELERMVAAKPGSAELQFRLAEALFREGEANRAVDHYQRSIACHADGDPASLKALALAGLGAAYIQQGDETGDTAKYAAAFTELKNAVALDPSRTAFYLRLVEALRKMGKDAEAQALLEKAKKIPPETGKDWLEWFYYFLAAGEAERAKAILGKALGGDQNSQVVLFLAGEAYFRYKMHGEAAEVFERVVEVNPSDIRPYNWLGICYRNLKKGGKAVASYKKALEIDPEDPNVHFNLGRACQMISDFAQARAEYEAALKFNPELKEASEALSQLPTA